MPGTGGPWGAGEKETTLAPVRALMRSGDVVAYSTLTEGRVRRPLRAITKASLLCKK
jgi:hypothetical protein